MSAKLLDRLRNCELAHEDLLAELIGQGISEIEAGNLLTELQDCRAVVSDDAASPGVQNPPPDFPLQTLVLNLTNQCNLSCEYCYEYGADKVATPEGKPKFMDLETAKGSVDFLLGLAAGRGTVQITFFGGETLMNFPLLREVVAYANRKVAERGGSSTIASQPTPHS